MRVVDSLVTAAVCALLLYGAVWDAKRRLIPNLVPVTLGIIGIMLVFAPAVSYWQIPLSERIAGFALPTVTLLILHTLKKPVGGGDLKLTAALGFLLGLTHFAAVYALGGGMALVWAAVKRQKSVPLATFLFPGVTLWLTVILFVR